MNSIFDHSPINAFRSIFKIYTSTFEVMWIANFDVTVFTLFFL